MIGTLAWKEFREHQTVWVAMAGLAILLMVILTQVLAPNGVAAASADKLQTIALAALILVGTYGLICGAMMVAGENEARTQTFLDTLPARRSRLWITKLLVGALFSLAYALGVTGVSAAIGLTEAKSLPIGWQLALPLVALESFGYGLFGSVLGRSVLGAVGWGLVPVAISWILGGEVWWPPTVFAIGARSTLLLCMLGLAGLIYCRTDLQRGFGGSANIPTRGVRAGQGGWGLEREPPPRHKVPRDAVAGSTESWRVLTWLALRQGWWQFLLLWAAGFVVGLQLPNAALVIWPVASLLVGVAFGLGMFSGEQAGQAYRFLGNQRFPSDRVWLAKATVWSAMAAGVLVVMLLGTVVHLASGQTSQGWHVRAASTTHSVWQLAGTRDSMAHGEGFLGSRLLLDYLPKDVFLLLWPLYGFSIGQFLALVCRKSAVALVLALLVSVPIVGLWIPSLVAGGLRLWQVLPCAVLLLLATRWGLWAWAGGVLKSWRPILGLVACAGLAGVWLAGSLVYRAVEVPAVGEPFNVAAFVADLPAPEQNQVGSLIHRAAQELAEQERSLDEKRDHPDPVVAFVPPDMPAQGPASTEDPIARVLENGWPDDDAELAAWLDQVCQGKWIDHLRAAAALPLGVVENPRLLSVSTRIAPNPVYQRAAQLLVARALQVQSREDHAGALDHLLWALALSRHLRHQAVEAFYQEGRSVEGIALQGLDRWLERLGPQAEPLARALAELNRHEELTPLATEPIKAEYLMLRERLDDPARWLLPGAMGLPTDALEHDLITLTLQTPWERERAVRFLDALTRSRLQEAGTPYWQLPLRARLWDPNIVPAEAASSTAFFGFVPDGADPPFTPGQWEHLLADSRLLLRLFALSSRPQHEKQALSLGRVRAARLKLALALYQVREEKPAPTLIHLVPHYLEELPLDPFSGDSFQYRVSKGEQIAGNRPAWAGKPAIWLAPGQGIFWSAGPDGSGRFGLTGNSFVAGGPFDDAPGQEHFLVAPNQVFIVPSWSR